MRRTIRSASRSRAGRIACLAGGAVLLLATGARADGVFLAGASGSTQDDVYGYAGLVLPVLGSTLDTDGFRVRLWAEGQHFKYDGVLPGPVRRTIDGNGVGAVGSIGYRMSGSMGTLTGYLGLKYRDIHLSPNDPGSNADNENLGVNGQLEYSTNLTQRLDLSLIGSYTGTFDEYWVRGRPGYTRPGSKVTWGPELIAYGGEKYDKQRLGLFSEGYEFAGGKLGFEVGGQHDSRENDWAAYFGASFSHRF